MDNTSVEDIENMDLIETEHDDLAKCKYKLRNTRRQDETKDGSGPKKRGPKPRLRSAGMSRYRRKEANARERQRQGEINSGFDKLREKIPHPGPSNGKCEKLRKIDILHVAINYIRALENILDHGEPGVNEFANSVYKVASKDEDASNSSSENHYVGTNHAFDDLGNASDSYSDESDSYDMAAQNYNMIGSPVFPTEQNRTQRKITLSSREEVMATNMFKPMKTPTEFLHQTSDFLAQEKFQTKPSFYQMDVNEMKMNVNCKIEMHYDQKPFNEVTSFKQQCIEKHINNKSKMPSAQTSYKQKCGDLPSFPDLSIDEFSDVSGSDPEDLFSDLNSSLESLHHLDAFSFFGDKQNLAF